MFEKLKSMLNMDKRGQTGLDQAPTLILLLVIIGIVGAIGLSVIDGIGASFTGDAALALGNITEAIGNFFALAPVLGTIFISVILLAAVGGLMYFAYMKNR